MKRKNDLTKLTTDVAKALANLQTAIRTERSLWATRGPRSADAKHAIAKATDQTDEAYTNVLAEIASLEALVTRLERLVTQPPLFTDDAPAPNLRPD